MRNCLLWAGLAAMLRLVAAEAAPVTLVSRGAPAAAIVIPAAPTPTEAFAAEELQRYVLAATGAILPLQDDDLPATGPFISLGRTEPAKALKYAADHSYPDPYVIRADADGLFILGRSDRGTIYGTYDFLRRYVGCRWIMPGPLGEIVPRVADVRVEVGDIEEEPAFRFRIAAGFRDEAYLDWAIKNRLQIWDHRPERWADPQMAKRGGFVKGTMHHAFDTIVPEEEYFAAHPEYFGLIGDKRVAGRGSQLCVSNPEVVKIVTQAALRYFDEHPQASFFSLCPNDNQNWCQCAECKAYDTETMERWGRQYPVVSDRYFAFVNKVAEAVARSHPGKLLYTFAYQNYTWPPRKHMPRDNVIVSLCHMVPACYSHPLTRVDCPQNVQFNSLVSGWAEAHQNMWYYAYTCKSMWEQMPWPIARRLAQDIRRLDQAGFQGFYSQGSQRLWGQLGINFRLMAPLLWDPQTDPEAVLQEYFALAFGPAAEPMRAFYAALEEGFSAPEVHVHHEADLWGPQVLTAEVRQRCCTALEQATQLAAGNETVGQRIEPVAAAYDYARLRVETLTQEKTWLEAGDAQALRQAVDGYQKIMDLGKRNPGGEALSIGSLRRYVAPRYERLSLPYDALSAPPEQRQYSWATAEAVSTSFEPGADGSIRGWPVSPEQEDCGVTIVRDQARTGEASLRLWSQVQDEDSPRMPALQHDWVIVSALSERVAVEPGQAVVASAWVLVPDDAEKTARGITLGLVGYSPEGDAAASWRPGAIETRQPTATGGWRRIMVARIVPQGVTSVGLRLAFSGLGEGYVDDLRFMCGTTR